MSENKDNKKIKIITGDGSNLDISPVEEHLTIAKPKTKKNKDKIVIPEEIKRDNSKK